MELVIITLSGISQSHKDKYYMFSLICGIREGSPQTYKGDY
jgi:hypothetical protein